MVDMELHETMSPTGIKDTQIIRVPGGWVYVCFDGNWSQMSSCFVPLSTEFSQ
jgi:hypothetical protein